MSTFLVSDDASITASMEEDSFSFVSPSSQRSVLRWSERYNPSTLDILLLDRLQREQREEAERRATQLMEEAIQIESLGHSVMLPSEEDAMDEKEEQEYLSVLCCRQNPVLRSLNNNNNSNNETNVLDSDISTLCTPRRRNSTGGDFVSRFFPDTVSDHHCWSRLQLPQDSQGLMDFSNNDCDYEYEYKSKEQNRHKPICTVPPLSLRPKISLSKSISTNRCHSDPPFQPIYSSLNSNSASSSSTASPATACPTDFEGPYLTRYGLPCHSLAPRERTSLTNTIRQLPPPLPIPLLPMMTPEYTKPTKSISLLDSAPGLVGFQTAPPLLVRRALTDKE